MHAFFRSKFFWVSLFTTTIGAAFFAYKHAPEALSIIAVDLQMTRNQALEKAAELATQHQWAPSNFHTAVQFKHEPEVQFFIELAGGGKQAFTQMMHNHDYEPYTWKVRHFKEHDTHETLIAFSPDGKPYDFLVKIPEDTISTNLTVQEARTKAEQFAHSWQVDFTRYQPLEATKDEKPCGRIDHIFIYQRNDITIGDEGRYRVRLIVSGDTVTSVDHYLFVPESFKRKYQEMRAGNMSLTQGATLIYLLLFFMIGGIGGGYWLFKNNLLQTKPALYWAAGLAFLMTLTNLNQLPLLWMHYNTATSSSNFIITQLFSSLLTFLYLFSFLFIVFGVAEGLTRAAFGNFPQLWKSFSGTNAATFTIAGYTIGGYCGALIQLAYLITTYFFFTKVMGWWTPGATFVDPNSLATYFPPLSSFATSLFAGFEEECLFRAIPLAGAALLGRYYKKERLFIGIAFITQVIVFGAAHASYTTYPAYFRLVELIPMGTIFGLIYLTFGLLPVVLIHWLYDFILMSLPLFVSQSATVLLYKIIVIALGLTPLTIVLYQWFKQKKLHELAEQFYNKTYQVKTYSESFTKSQKAILHTITTKTKTIIISAGFVGLIIWAIFTPFKNQTAHLSASKEAIITQAQNTIKTINPNFLTNTTPIYTIVTLQKSDQYNFVWQQLGQEWYQKLTGSYLPDYYFYSVKFVHFEGDLLERAEHYELWINNQEKIFKIKHTIPEQQAGTSLTEQEARILALKKIEEEYGLYQTDLKEIAAQEEQKPARKNWIFTFEDITLSLPEGKPYIKITINGDEITDYERFIFIPEQWQRTEAYKTQIRTLVASGCLYTLLLLAFFALALLLPSFLRKFSVKQLGLIIGSIIIFSVFILINMFPTYLATFNTAQPYSSQLFSTIIIGSLTIIQRSFLFGLIATILLITTKTSYSNTSKRPILGAAVGAALYGLYAFIHTVTPSLTPTIANYSALNSYLPLLYTITTPIALSIRYSSILFLLIVLLNLITNYWTQNKLTGSALMLIMGIACYGFFEVITFSSTVLGGIAFGLLFMIAYQLILHKDYSLIPWVVGTIIGLYQLQQLLFNPYSLSIVSGIAAIGILSLFTGYWYKKLQNANS